MNSTLITMEPEQAKAKLKAYRSNIHKDTEQVYAECAEAYEALAAGTPLIELTTAIREGGFDDKMRPRIAVGPADRSEVRFTWSGNETSALFDAAFKTSHRGSPRLRRRINMGRQHGQVRNWKDGNGQIQTYVSTVDGYALIPMVPADVRPATGQLRDWYVLWEVQEWADKPHTAPPPRDPYLIKHIGGDLYAVLAEWDLTDLERAIMQRQITAR